jgi:hypothetical protein
MLKQVQHDEEEVVPERGCHARPRQIGSDPAVQRQLDRLTLLLARAPTFSGSSGSSAAVDGLGNPHLALPPVFHVAGTNGKGSTCAYLRAAIEAAGMTAHVYHQPASGALQRADPYRRHS